MKIAVVGLGYVGLANAVLLAQYNEVYAFDVDIARVEMVNDRKSPIVDEELEEFLESHKLNLIATPDPEIAYADAEFVIVATPTNFNTVTNHFDTTSVEVVIADVIRINPKAVIVIKSTVQVGFVDTLRRKFNSQRIIFSPEL